MPAWMAHCCCTPLQSLSMLMQRPACPQPPTQLTKGLGVPQLQPLQQVDLQLARLPRHPVRACKDGWRRRCERRRPRLGGRQQLLGRDMFNDAAAVLHDGLQGAERPSRREQLTVRTPHG